MIARKACRARNGRMVQAARAGDDEMSRIALEEVGREEGKVALIRHQGAAEPGRSLPERAAIGPHLFRKLAVFAPLESQEMARFQGLASSEGQVPADHHLVRAGEEYGPVIVVNSGWAVRYRMLADGWIEESAPLDGPYEESYAMCVPR